MSLMPANVQNRDHTALGGTIGGKGKEKASQPATDCLTHKLFL